MGGLGTRGGSGGGLGLSGPQGGEAAASGACIGLTGRPSSVPALELLRAHVVALEGGERGAGQIGRSPA